MLPGATVGLLLGVWLFQQQAVLWSWLAWALWLLGLLFAFGLAAHARRQGRRWGQLVLIMVLMAALGFAWAQGRAWWRLQSALPAACEQQAIPVQVVLVGVPARDDRGQHVDAVIEKSFDSACPVSARVRLHLYQQRYQGQSPPVPVEGPLLQAGERWRVSVKLRRPHGTRNPHGFDYAAWCLANQIAASGHMIRKAPMQRLHTQAWRPDALVASGRAAVGQRITQVLGHTAASGVVRALVIGDDSQISRADWQLFVDTGINHLVSISGLHITMLAALVMILTAWIWRRFPAWVARWPSSLVAGGAGALAATAYALLAGYSIPTQRTLYMLLTVLALRSLRRPLPFSWTLAVALWMVLLVDPWAVLAPGFWLSFGAVALLAWGMSGRLRPLGGWQAAVHSQWLITLAFAPILMSLFNQVSVVSPLANAVAIPLVSLAVVPLSIAGALLPVDGLLQWAAALWEGCAQALHWLRQWPWAVSYWPTPPLWAWGLAMVGVLVALMPRGWPLRWAGLLCTLPLLMPQPTLLRAGQMRVTVLDVGQGLSVLVQTARHSMLYDAGPAYDEESDAGQRIVLPYLRHLGLSRLDMAVVSHDDSDHVGGMASVLAGVPAQQLLSSLPSEATFFSRWHALAPRQSLPHVPCQVGQHWQWDQVTFKVLGPAAALPASVRDNDRSCVILVVSGHGRLLLTGDIEATAERALLASQASQLRADVMTMPHHGSKTSSTPAFVQQVQPALAIATVGYLNRFGHPKPQVLQRYQALGSRILRSDTDGAIVLDFVQGAQPAVVAWRSVAPHYWETPPAPTGRAM